ncbi:MAG TPA: HPF/RaiA family ribosome-associated protein [Candidatus Xenobia bacterium]|nr:HPF/RaiA family ribosome-associated protein [Candidatus Xenobia bacterium]
MKSQVRFRGISDRNGVEREMRRQVAKLERHLKKFSPDLVDLHVSLERRALPTNPFLASVTLYLPPGQLHASEVGPAAVLALKYAFAELWREVKKMKAKLQRKTERRRASPRRPAVLV